MERPAPDQHGVLAGTDPTQVALDDTSMITLDDQAAFFAWGDWRPGDVQGFFSAVKLQAFSFHQH